MSERSAVSGQPSAVDVRRPAIPFNDLKEQHVRLRAELDAAIERVLDSGWFVLGREVEAFEREFAAFVGVEHGAGVASGTDAIAVGLGALGVEAGDEVITVAHTAVPTVAAIEQIGARPVLVEINAGTYTLDPAALASAIGPRTRAIVPVHLYGHAADMEPILTTARAHGLAVLEDCAQAHGAEYRGRRVGGLGDAAAFSFYPTKNLGGCGDGGMVVTDDPEVAERARRLRNYGQARRYLHESRGVNSRLDELQAAVLRAKLPYLGEWNEARRALAALYDAELGAAADSGALFLPAEAAWARHVYHLYVVRCRRRDDLQRGLAERGVGTLIHYPIPVHLQPAYGDLGHAPGDLPVTELVASEILSLPLYPELGEEAIHTVAAAVNETLEGLGVRG